MLNSITHFTLLEVYKLQTLIKCKNCKIDLVDHWEYWKKSACTLHVGLTEFFCCVEHSTEIYLTEAINRILQYAKVIVDCALFKAEL